MHVAFDRMSHQFVGRAFAGPKWMPPSTNGGPAAVPSAAIASLNPLAGRS